MSHETRTVEPGGEVGPAGSAWNGLYRIGGVAALVATLLFLIDIVVLTALGPQPSTASGWFSLLQNSRVVGLFQLFFTDLLGVTLLCPVFLALYGALRRSSAAYSALAMALGLTGIATAIATNTAYSMVYLSDQYAAATMETQRSLLLAAGEAMAAIGNGTGSFVMAGLLMESAPVMLSVVMLRGNIFSKATAYLGILAHGLDLAHFHLPCLHPYLQPGLRAGDWRPSPGYWGLATADMVCPGRPKAPTAGTFARVTIRR